MRKMSPTIFTTLLAATFILAQPLFAQVPQKMSYQAVIRNSNNQLVTKQVVGMKISVLQGSTSASLRTVRLCKNLL
jgi:hypothetical protein